MIRILIATISFLSILLFAGCNKSGSKAFNSDIDIARLKYIERSQQYKLKIPSFDSLKQSKLTKNELGAITFLYAYMPLSDIADYNFDFHLINAKMALTARAESPWREVVSDQLFYHFILPQRINNENLDSFRLKYYSEIKERIDGISNITDAALEINHWCHEKVTYQPADIRTSGPVATILSARGRCGEESTFTAAALRLAGIPARQVYTPRWAHSDDNHAWVEFWDGEEWRYLGACEPEPVPDRGWFTEPAKRAMLVHTKVFGAYNGSEKTTFRSANYAEINMLRKYALTKDITVKVKNSDGSIAEKAVVDFLLYNYAQYYPLASLQVNKEGSSTFSTGLGDLLIWVSDSDRYTFKKIYVKDTDTLELTLPDKGGPTGLFNYDLMAPPVQNPGSGLSKDLIKANSKRLVYEDSVRSAYVNLWITKDKIVDFAKQYAYSSDQLCELLPRSMGNYKEILLFLQSFPEKADLTVSLLSVVSNKDLRDTRAEIFEDHLLGFNSQLYDNYSSDIIKEYILNPRIENEILTKWRLYLQDYFKENKNEFVSKPELIEEWITDNIKITDSENYYNVPISPQGVISLKESDRVSSDILFVSICRSLGIPARLEPGTGKPQYYKDGLWIRAVSDIGLNSLATVSIKNIESRITPLYSIHFTLARLENGRFITLDYPFNKGADSFPADLMLEAGRYMLVTGNRIDDKKVLSSIYIFDITPGENKSISINLRSVDSEKTELGSLDPEFLNEIYLKSNLSRSEDKPGVVIVWIEHEKEPTKHLLNSLPDLKGEFDGLGLMFIFLSDPASISESYLPEKLPGLPELSLFILDKGRTLLAKTLINRNPDEISYPYTICVNGEGKILFISEGYNIGSGEQILKAFKK